MKRLMLALMAFATIACVPLPAKAPGTATFVYGDSVTVQAQPYMKPGAVVRARNGYSPCVWFPQMRADAANWRPRTVVLAFVGNYLPVQCDADSSRYDSYRAAFSYIRSVFPSTTRIVVVVPPAHCPPASPNDDVVRAVYDSGLPTINAQSIGCEHKTDGIHLTDAGARLYAGVLGTAY